MHPLSLASIGDLFSDLVLVGVPLFAWLILLPFLIVDTSLPPRPPDPRPPSTSAYDWWKQRGPSDDGSS